MASPQGRGEGKATVSGKHSRRIIIASSESSRKCNKIRRCVRCNNQFAMRKGSGRKFMRINPTFIYHMGVTSFKQVMSRNTLRNSYDDINPSSWGRNNDEDDEDEDDDDFIESLSRSDTFQVVDEDKTSRTRASNDVFFDEEYYDVYRERRESNFNDLPEWYDEQSTGMERRSAFDDGGFFYDDKSSEYSSSESLRLQEAASWLKERGTLRRSYKQGYKKYFIGTDIPLPLVTSCKAVPQTTSTRKVAETIDIDVERDTAFLKEVRQGTMVMPTEESRDVKLPPDGYYNDNNYVVFSNCQYFGENQLNAPANDEDVAVQLREEAINSILKIARDGPIKKPFAESKTNEEVRDEYIRSIYTLVSSAEDYGILDDCRLHHGIAMAYINNQDMVGAVHAIRDAELLGVTPLGETYALLLRTFAKNGAVEDAEAVLGAMENAGYNPRGGWCVLTATLAEINMTDDFMRNFDKGCELGYRPTEEMWEYYLKYLVQCGEINKASSLVHGYMLDCGIERNARFDNIILRGYIERDTIEGCKDVIAARNWMELNMLDGYNPTKPNAETFNILLEGTIISPMPDEDPVMRCAIMIDQMRKLSVKPDPSTWILMIIYCAKYCSDGYDWCGKFYENFRNSFEVSFNDSVQGKEIPNTLVREVLMEGKGANEMFVKHKEAFAHFFSAVAALSDFRLLRKFISDCVIDNVIIPKELFRPKGYGPLASAMITSPFLSGAGTLLASPGLLWYSMMINYPRKMENLQNAPQTEWNKRKRFEKKLTFNRVSQIFPQNIRSTITSTQGHLRGSRKTNLHTMKVEDFRKALSEAGLETWGTRPVLQQRYRDHLKTLERGFVSKDAIKDKAKKDMEALRKGLQPSADFTVHLDDNYGSVLLSDLERPPWGSRGQEAVVNVAGLKVPIGELVMGSFGDDNLGTNRLKKLARHELQIYLQLLPMCSKIGVRASALDFSVMLQTSCGLADVPSTVKVLLFFRSHDASDAWIVRRIKSPLRYLIEHCFDSHEKTTSVSDGLLVIDTMRKVGIKIDEEIANAAKEFEDENADEKGEQLDTSVIT